MKPVLFFIFCMFLLGFSPVSIVNQGNMALELPKPLPNDDIVHHKAYTLSYNETHEQANWVAYQMFKSRTLALFNRKTLKCKFKTDPLVKTGTADDQDYKNSKMDKGHLCPAADMSWDADALRETFYYSNMSPQNHGFNAGVWSRLEEKIRQWAGNNETLFIATGPVLRNGLKYIGHNHVSVPDVFYKVVLEKTGKGFQGIGFLVPHAASTLPLQRFVVTIDSVEKLTGLNFFYQLSEKEQNAAESVVKLNQWVW